MKIIQQILLATALGLCATHAFADGPDSAIINFTGSIEVPPCTITPPGPVDIGTVQISDFNKGDRNVGKGSDFTVNMTCPAGIKALSYRLDPSGGSTVYDAGSGVMSSSNTGGASGVGVRVIDESGSPKSVPLGTSVPISTYDPNKDDQSVPLKFRALFYKTDGPVTGGKVEAQATLTLSYE